MMQILKKATILPGEGDGTSERRGVKAGWLNGRGRSSRIEKKELRSWTGVSKGERGGAEAGRMAFNLRQPGRSSLKEDCACE